MTLCKNVFFASIIFLALFLEWVMANPFSEVNLRAGLISALKQHPSILDFYKEIHKNTPFSYGPIGEA